MGKDYVLVHKDSSDYLVHYGTKGMSWGKRRFQNLDGTYTAEGLKRYFGNAANAVSGYVRGVTGQWNGGNRTYGRTSDNGASQYKANVAGYQKGRNAFEKFMGKVDANKAANGGKVPVTTASKAASMVKGIAPDSVSVNKYTTTAPDGSKHGITSTSKSWTGDDANQRKNLYNLMSEQYAKKKAADEKEANRKAYENTMNALRSRGSEFLAKKKAAEEAQKAAEQEAYNNSVKGKLNNAYNSVKDKAADAKNTASNLYNTAKGKASDAYDYAKEYANSVKDNVTYGYQKGTQNANGTGSGRENPNASNSYKIAEKAGELYTNASNKAKDAYNDAKATAAGIKRGLTNEPVDVSGIKATSSAQEKLNSAYNATTNAISKIASSKTATDIATAYGEATKQAKSAYESAKDTASSAYNSALKVAQNAYNTATQNGALASSYATAKLQKAKSDAKSAYDSAVDKAKSTYDSAVDKAKSAYDQAKDYVKSTGDRYYDGVGSGFHGGSAEEAMIKSNKNALKSAKNDSEGYANEKVTVLNARGNLADRFDSGNINYDMNESTKNDARYTFDEYKNDDNSAMYSNTKISGADTPLERIAIKELMDKNISQYYGTTSVNRVMQKIQSDIATWGINELTKNETATEYVNKILKKFGF